jgi:hypothetical protein
LVRKLVVRGRLTKGKGKDWVDLVTYVMDPAQRPYLHPVCDPSGKTILTADRPADHPWQHGIFTGFHQVNGLNYWKEDQGRQRFVRLLDLKEEADRVSWRSLTELVAPDGQSCSRRSRGALASSRGSPLAETGIRAPR